MPPATSMTAQQIIDHLDLSPHPEGGHFRQTWVAPTTGDARAMGTAIFFLLAGDEVSHWHKVDATEIWHFHAGAPLVLSSPTTMSRVPWLKSMLYKS